MGARGGAFIGLLLGLVWVAARLGLARTLNAQVLLTELNVMAVMAMITIGGLAGAMFASMSTKATDTAPLDDYPRTLHEPKAPATQVQPAAPPRFIMLEAVWGEALARQREWMADWDQASSPWTSFDTHIRELTRMLTGLRHLRSYRVGADGRLYPLEPGTPTGTSCEPHRAICSRTW